MYLHEEIRFDSWVGFEDAIQRAGQCRGKLKHSQCQAIVVGGGM